MATTKVFSTQDGTVSEITSIVSRKVEYRDIDLSFAKKTNGELFIKKDAAAVIQAVKNLIQTNHFEKPFEPFFGGNVRALLFELADDDVEIEIEEAIAQTINEYEPRAKVLNIFVNSNPDMNDIRVTLEFQILNTEEVVEFTTALSRLR
tara:strand:- start:2769 stop:3215 length:447 start_codon:yes stop_codon:yes gene_type:complete